MPYQDSISGRVDFVADLALPGRAAKKPVPQASVTLHWQKDKVPEGIPDGWYRLFNGERQHYGLVVRQLMYEDGTTADRVYWRIFTSTLHPRYTPLADTAEYSWVEDDQLIEIGYGHMLGDYPNTLAGWAGSVEEAQAAVVEIIQDIWDKVGVVFG